MKLLSILALSAVVAGAQASLYFQRSAFLADPLATNLFNEDFESYALGTNLQGTTVGNATLNAPFTTTLIVQNTGVRFGGFPSSGTQMISPGGTVTTQENDDLTITFGTPVQAAGIDVCFDVADGAAFTNVKFLDSAGATLFSGAIPCPIGAPGYTFVGATSGTTLIKSIVFDEFDASASDDHILYDSMVYSTVPEPSSLVVLAMAGLGLRGRRSATKK